MNLWKIPVPAALAHNVHRYPDDRRSQVCFRTDTIMNNASYIALSRQMALYRQMATSANNMANIDTPAFKGEEMMFRQHLTKSLSQDRNLPEKIAFVKDQGVLRDTREGTLSPSGNALDVAISGEGYFVIDTPDGPRYTRNGHFTLDDQGMLITSEGFAVMQQGDLPFFFAPNETEVLVNRDGSVATENGTIGTIRVVHFENEQMLRKAGDSQFDSEEIPADVENPTIVQGMMESSNVQGVVEMTRLIDIMRHFDMAQRMIESEHDRQQKTVQTLGQIARS